MSEMISDYFDLVGELWPIAWSQLWQVTLLILVVAPAVRLFTKNRAHLAHLLWLVVLIKCLTPPICASPGGVFSRMEAWFSETPTVQAAAPLELSVSLGSPPETQPAPPCLQRPAPSARAADVEWTEYVGIVLWVLISSWPVGVVLTATVFAWRWTAAVRSIHRSSRPADSELQQLFESLQRRLRIRRRVRLLITESPFGPAVVGTFRPTIVLPESLLHDKSPADLEPILAHELLHIRRGDTWIGLLQTVLASLWWFHPLVLWASRRLSREAERCCDESVIAELSVKPADYARCLLDVLEGKQTSSPIPAFPAMRPVEAVSKRMERIMRSKHGWKRRMPRVYWIVMVLLLAAVLPGAVWSESEQEPEESLKSFSARMIVRPQPAEPDILNQPPGGTASDGEGAVGEEPYVELYRTASLVKAIQTRDDVEEEAAKAKLLATIMDSLNSKAFIPRCVVLARTSIGRDEAVFDEAESLELRLDEDGLKWVKNDLVAIQSRAVHSRLKNVFEFLRKSNGTDATRVEADRQLAIEVHFISRPVSRGPLLTDGWVLSEATFSESASTVRPVEQPVKPDAEHSLSPGVRLQPVEPPDLEPIASGTRARTVVERRLAAVFQVLDDEAARDLLDRAQEDRRTNVLQAPITAVYNGQSAFVSDTSHSPFVVGVREIKGTFASAQAPQIQVVPEGTMVRMRAFLQKNGGVRLECRTTLSRIGDCDVKIFRGVPTLQVPTVAKHEVDTAVEMPLGQTLVIGGLETKDHKGKYQSTLILIRPTKVAEKGA